MLITAWRLLIAVAAAGALLWGVGQAAANYPPPGGSVSAAASDTTPAPGADVTVTCSLVDSAGQPVADEPCAFEIISGDASFDGSQSTVANTDADGIAVAVLSTGATPGTIIVETSVGDLTSQVTVSTGTDSGAGQLPTTGGASGGSSSPPALPLIGAVAGGLLLAAGGAHVLRVARRSDA